MNRQTNFNFIEEKLSLLATCIEMRGGLNILDLHLHSEIFYLHFFNLLFGWDLQNLNAVEKNADGEKYALKVDTKIVKGSRLYEFTPFDLNNFSSGKNRVKYPALISPTRSLPMKRISPVCIFSSTIKRVDAW